MTSSLTTIVLSQLQSCANQVITENALHEFLAAIIWEMDSFDDDEAKNLIYGAELLLSEYKAGHRSDQSFRRELQTMTAYYNPTTTSENMYTRLPSVSQPLIVHNGS